jgi:hypothetical protein
MFLKKNGNRYAAGLSFGLFLALASCNFDRPQQLSEEVVLNQGIQTSVQEVMKDSFLITDEVLMTNPDSSRVVAEYLDGRVDTVYVKEIQEHHNHYHGGGSSFLMNYLFFRAITGGYMGYHFGRPYHYTPDSRYYRNQSTYNRVRNTTGSTVTNTMRRKPVSSSRGVGSSGSSSRSKTTRPSSGRSGYGRSSGSSRSYGG